MKPTSSSSTTNLVPLTISFLERFLLMAAVDHRTVASFAILAPRPIMELAAPSTDIVGTLTLTVELGARADVMAQPVVLLQRLLQLQRPLEPKSPYWARLQVRLGMALILLMV